MNVNVTLLGQMLTFAFFIWITLRFIWPPLIRALEERQKKIAEGLAAAEHGQKMLDNAKQEAVHAIRAAKNEAAEIVEKAQLKSAKLVEEARMSGRKEGHRLISEANHEIKQKTAQAQTELTHHIVDMAVAFSSKVMQKTVDRETHQKLLDELIEQLE